MAGAPRPFTFRFTITVTTVTWLVAPLGSSGVVPLAFALRRVRLLSDRILQQTAVRVQLHMHALDSKIRSEPAFQA